MDLVDNTLNTQAPICCALLHNAYIANLSGPREVIPYYDPKIAYVTCWSENHARGCMVLEIYRYEGQTEKIVGHIFTMGNVFELILIKCHVVTI